MEQEKTFYADDSADIKKGNRDKDLLKAFQVHLRFERACSQRTVELYMEGVKLFQKVIDKPLFEVDRDDIRVYLQNLYGRRLKPNTIAYRFKGVKSLYNWLAGEDEFLSQKERVDLLSLCHYMSTRIKIKTPGMSFTMPYRDEINKLRACLNGEPPKRMPLRTLLRDRAMIEILIASGLRNKELRGLVKHDMDLERGIIHVRNGKGGKIRPALFNGKAKRALKDYFSVIDDHRVLFDINRGEISQRVKYWLQRAHLNPRYTPHSFRHYCLTNLLEQGMSIRAVADLAGHESIKTTQRYTHLSVQRLKKEYDECDI